MSRGDDDLLSLIEELAQAVKKGRFTYDQRKDLTDAINYYIHPEKKPYCNLNMSKAYTYLVLGWLVEQSASPSSPLKQFLASMPPMTLNASTKESSSSKPSHK